MKLEITTGSRTYGIELPWSLLVAALTVGLLWQPATAWASNQFSDVPDSNVFHDDIAWMADNGVTAGCNPPANDRFCPGDTVTREQMSAFMRRLDTRNVFTTFSEVESMVATGSSGPIDADTLDGINSTAFATDAEVSGLLATLLARIDALEATLAGVSRDGDVLRFSGMNIQVVDGSGDTEGAVNGLGNLIVGYDENSQSYDRGGSHNLVVGADHGYSAYGGFVAGFRNRSAGNWASVSGGSLNTASANSASVSGGQNNAATGANSSVSGGSENTASVFYASVSGGRDNTASGTYSSVSGGFNRTVSAIDDWAAGGLFEDS